MQDPLVLEVTGFDEDGVIVGYARRKLWDWQVFWKGDSVSVDDQEAAEDMLRKRGAVTIAGVFHARTP